MDKKPGELKVSDLMRMYSESEAADNKIFAEQRSNTLLVAGNHYAKNSSRFWNRVRDDKSLTQEQKLRITKNHIQKICKTYENNILTYCPTTTILPRNETELQDQKTAELNKSVWEYVKSTHKFNELVRYLVQDYVRIGEACLKVFWDANKGKLKGYEQKTELGAPVFDEMGQPVIDETKPVFTGDFVFDISYGFNTLRAKEAKRMSESRFMTIRKMVDVNELKQRVKGDEEKERKIRESSDRTYKILDTNTGSYTEAKNQCLYLETYFRPSADYPNGYFYHYTDSVILFEGELPFGIFPLHYVGFDEVPTQPRSFSIIKVARPYQAEINRASSKIAETQITLGDDKLLIQAGTKITNGGILPGVRGVQYAGAPPQILQGRSGEQYLNYLQAQINEMYTACNLTEEVQEKPQTNDPYTELFKNIKQKKKYAIYAEKFGDFLCAITETTMNIAKQYLDESTVIPMIGRSEIINIPEFKTSEPLCYRVKVEQSTEDLDSQMGKQLTLNQILQYVGGNLDKNDIGRIIKLSPFVNKEQITEDLTLDFDMATNQILALDRGEYKPPAPYQDHKYMLRRLASRMSKGDFDYLPVQIKQLYDKKVQAHQQAEAQEIEALKKAQSELIPTGGYMVACDFYIQSNANDPTKTQRVRLPSEAIQWLLDRMNQQGATQDALQQVQQGMLAQLAQRMAAGQPQQLPQGQGVML